MQELKILVIDDRAADIEHAASILRQQGHTILSASDGSEGVKMAESTLPDLILMDLVMPQLNGFQATRELCRNETTKHIPIIIISCKDEESDKVWALKQGARAYLPKGFDDESLLNSITRVMDEDRSRYLPRQAAE